MDYFSDEVRKTDLGAIAPFSVEDAERMIEMLEPHAGKFVSFQTEPVLALNPEYSNEVTPQAIYGFPTDYLLEILPSVLKYTKRRDMVLAIDNLGYVRRPHAFFFSLRGTIVDTRSYVGLVRDMEHLLERFQAEGSPAASLVTSWMRSSTFTRAKPDPFAHSRYLVMLTEQIIDSQLGILDQPSPYRHHPRKPYLWRELLMSLGHDAFLDMNSTLTGDLRIQVAVFNPDAMLDIEGPLANPCFLTEMEERQRNGKRRRSAP